MCGRIGPELKGLEGLGQNSNGWNNKVRIPVFGNIGQEFQCFKE